MDDVLPTRFVMETDLLMKESDKTPRFLGRLKDKNIVHLRYN